jgi:hypothetical protein
MRTRDLRAARSGVSGLGLMLALLGASVLGCVQYHHHHYHDGAPPKVAKGHGPPPHAPAHGHRHKHHDQRRGDLELVFDADLDVYVVLGHPEHYHHGGTWLRWRDGRWELATEFGGVWVRASNEDVPPKLRRKMAKRHRGRGHGKGHGWPAKHDEDDD